jgi:hypothetical protein
LVYFEHVGVKFAHYIFILDTVFRKMEIFMNKRLTKKIIHDGFKILGLKKKINEPFESADVYSRKFFFKRESSNLTQNLSQTVVNERE